MQEMLEETEQKEVDNFVEEDFPDVKKEKDVAATPEAKAAFSRKPYYMFSSGMQLKKVKMG